MKRPSLDSQMLDIALHPQGPQIIEKHFPGLMAQEHWKMVKGLNPKQFAALSGGAITKQMLRALEDDLDAL